MTRDQLKKLEDDLWSAADNLRANSDLKASEYGTPVLGLIFLKFADINYRRHEAAIQAEHAALQGTRRERPLDEIAVARCGFYLPKHARYSYLRDLPEYEDIAKAIENAMASIEHYKPELRGSLPKDEYYRLTRTPETRDLPFELLRQFDNIPDDATGDVFGQIYEYFLGKFAMAEGQGGGEFFNPRSVVRLMVEIIEPHGGTVFDPACGSGGMFVQSADFIARHRQELEAQGQDTSVYVYGQEKQGETVKLARMNLAVNGLRGEIKAANTYYADEFKSFGTFDYVLANPPFNVDDVALSSVEKDRRFNTYGIPRNKTKAKKSEQGKETVPNANYLWINLFATSLKATGRAALVMANSASDARHGEAECRRTLIEKNLIYGMLTLPSNMFYTVTLPATLWFFDKAKRDARILFIDARNIFTQIDRAHRELTEEQVQNIAIISRLHKGRRGEFLALIDRYFASGMQRLADNRQQVEPVSAQLLAVLEDEAGKAAVASLVKAWDGLEALQLAYAAYQRHNGDQATVEDKNSAQRALRATFDPFFTALHDCLKQLDRAVRHQEKQVAEQAKADGRRGGPDRQTKALKTALEAIHAEVRSAESWFSHIHWLQERFPEARYEDVTGLCKLADLDEVKEQDYSLNPGRYVGLVIEGDGKTDEEFITEFLDLHHILITEMRDAEVLDKLIQENAIALFGE
ncbi:type I restriction-modification system subunit M [Candidatus Thiodictyon syntrophicum]|jgi:type I restriction enzyme M protein|uniref:site-specific DNA-methyltransferase (adenine-specific) n=1 Tax=Candidatus Thiodictyon syntrophicum TaxID=1166950 RepID=A0A2K8U6I2_9GAMM|nr:class I SAM-dependent DNA methyltransferase [Candidatus Thiodictyon syntrophicum]AUB81200.1 N-6 DNA methylase [Candidatus Thiodictyon syntrophicum]